MTIQITITRVLVALALGAIAGLVHAAKVGILVEGVDEAGIQCGVDTAAIEGRMRVALRSAGVTVDLDPLPRSKLYATYSFSRKIAPNICVVSLHLEINTFGKAPDNAEFTPQNLNRSGKFIACEFNGLGYSAIGTFANQFLDYVESATKDCLGRAEYK